MRFVMVVFLLIALPAVGTASQEVMRTGKAPWELSSDERLALRFNPQLAAKRASLRVESAGAGGLWSEVSGSVSPEIFLPIELFTALMGGIEADDSFREVYRAGLRDRIIEFGVDEEEFWRELEQLTTPHMELMARNDALAQQVRVSAGRRKRALEVETIRLQAVLCSSRVDALERARQHFKAINFDRFLYTVVAPDLTVTSVSPDGETAEHLLFLERGCK